MARSEKTEMWGRAFVDTCRFDAIREGLHSRNLALLRPPGSGRFREFSAVRVTRPSWPPCRKLIRCRRAYAICPFGDFAPPHSAAPPNQWSARDYVVWGICKELAGIKPPIS